MQATHALRNDQRLTTLTLLRDRDVSMIGKQTLFHQSPALWIRGGALIEKSASIIGNLYVGGCIFGNICSEIILTDTIHEIFPGQGIAIYGNVTLEQGSTLTGSLQITTMNGAAFCANLQTATVGDTLIWNGAEYCPTPSVGGGTVTSITAGTGLSGGTITTTGIIALSLTNSTSNTTYFPTFVASSSTGDQALNVSPNFLVNDLTGALGLG